MRIGFGAPVSGAWATPQYLSRFAAQAETAGYGSLWTFQRLLVPEGSAMEPVYHSVLDPMVALGYAAAVTSRIRLGVAVVNMPYLAPAYLAKQAASVDVLSGGRLDLGLGLGWMPEEFAAADAVMAGRGARTDEYIEVMRRLWAGREGIDVVKAAAAAAGRDPDAIRVICRGVVRWGAPVTVPEGGGRVPLSGSFDDIRADTQWLAGQGVTEVFYDLNWDPLVGAPDVDPAGAAARAQEVLEGLAPGR